MSGNPSPSRAEAILELIKFVVPISVAAFAETL